MDEYMHIIEESEVRSWMKKTYGNGIFCLMPECLNALAEGKVIFLDVNDMEYGEFLTLNPNLEKEIFG